MQEINVTINADRTGSVSGYLGGLTKELYHLNGPANDGVKAVLLTPDGRTLAVSDAAVGGAVEMDTDTQEVADLLRYQPVGAEAAVHIAIGDPDNLIAIVPATLRKNWLDDSAVHPPVPLPQYWTAAQTQKALEGKQDTLVAGDNITLEPQDDGTVKVSATAEPITVDKTVPTTAAGADPTHAASTPMAMQRLIGRYRPKIDAATGKITGIEAGISGFALYGSLNNIVYYRCSKTNEFMLAGARSRYYFGSGAIYIDYNFQDSFDDSYCISFCGTYIGDFIEIGYCAQAFEREGCSTPYFNIAFGPHTRIGTDYYGETANAAAVFGVGAYSNMCNSVTLGASDAYLAHSVQLSLVAYDQMTGEKWVGFSYRDELSGVKNGAKMSADQFISMLKAYGASDWEGPWGQSGCCGDYCGDEYCSDEYCGEY